MTKTASTGSHPREGAGSGWANNIGEACTGRDPPLAEGDGRAVQEAKGRAVGLAGLSALFRCAGFAAVPGSQGVRDRGVSCQGVSHSQEMGIGSTDFRD